MTFEFVFCTGSSRRNKSFYCCYVSAGDSTPKQLSELQKIMTRLINQASILKIITNSEPQALLECMESSFTTYSSGAAVVPPVGTLVFEEPPGETHIKYGYLKGDPYYVIKIASGFYDNPALGLPTSNGLNLVFSQATGALECILLDEGMLTDLRTALAGAVVAKHFAPATVSRIGIFGTGVQARLQLEYLQYVCNCREATVWGRSQEKLNGFCQDMESKGFAIKTTQDAKELVAECNLIVTTTPARSPVVPDCRLLPGTLITAMGADTLGKQELDESILQQADLIVMDSRSQCTHHGEIHKAWESDLLAKTRMEEIGVLISKEFVRHHADDVVIADLTGIATQDILISQFVLKRL